jgi:hypothetical protein
MAQGFKQCLNPRKKYGFSVGKTAKHGMKLSEVPCFGMEAAAP